MKFGKITPLTIAAGLLSMLSACGGGSSSTDSGAAFVPPTTDQVAAFAASYNTGVAGLQTFSGLTNSSFVDLFDDAFLDAGYNKQALKDNLAQESYAVSATADLSSFPTAGMSDVTVSACNANGICTLTATVTNSDADTTTVTYSIPVKFSGGKLRMYGDQKNA